MIGLMTHKSGQAIATVVYEHVSETCGKGGMYKSSSLHDYIRKHFGERTFEWVRTGTGLKGPTMYTK